MLLLPLYIYIHYMITIYHICLMKRLDKEEKIIAPVYVKFM